MFGDKGGYSEIYKVGNIKENMKEVKIVLIVLIISFALVIAGYVYLAPETDSEIDSESDPKITLEIDCVDVAPENQNICCENWARENDISHILCVGGWEIKNGKCGWACG